MRFTEEFPDGRTIEHTIDTSAIAAVTAGFNADDNECDIRIFFVGGYCMKVYPPTTVLAREMIEMIKQERKEFISVCWKVEEGKFSITTSPYSAVAVESELGRGNRGILRVVFDYSGIAEFTVENVRPDRLLEEGIDSNTAVFMSLKQHIENNLMKRYI